MGMTLKSMVEEVQEAVGNKASDFRNRIISVINRKREITHNKHFPKGTRTTLSHNLLIGTAEYDLASTVGFIHYATGANGRQIEAKDEVVFQREFAGHQDMNGPTEIIRVFGRSSSGGLKIFAWPIPESGEAITLFISSKPSTLANDDDTSEFELAFDQVVMEQTIEYCSMLNRDPEMASVAGVASRQSSKDFGSNDEDASGGSGATEIRQDDFVTFRREND